MAYKDFAIASFWQSSYFKSWARNNWGSLTRGYTTPSTSTLYKSVTVSGIPVGATITAYNIYFSRSTGTYGGTGTPASGAAVNPSSIPFTWKSNTGGSYPSYPTSNTGDSTNYSDKTGSAQITGCYVRVTYTDPPPPPPGESDLSLSTQYINAGESITAYIGPKNASYWHRLRIGFGAASYSVDIAAGTNSSAYTIPMDWLKQIPNSYYGQGAVYLDTYNGGTLVGTKSLALFVYAPATVVPTLTGITATLVSNGVDASITRYVQNYSKCALEITGAAGAYDSTISSYKITGGGYTINSVSGNAGPFNTTGDITLTALITDSRGRTATATITITVDAYNLPSLTAISAFRCDEYGTADTRGGYVLLKATPVISSIGEQNIAAIAGRYYMKGGTPGAPEAMVSNTDKILGGGLLLPVKTYIAEIIVQDLLNTYAVTVTIPTDKVALHFLDGVQGGAIGKYAELPGLMECVWPIIAPSLYGHQNLLHNPDFRNPVNQRAVSGAISTGAEFYDCWIRNSGTVTTNAAYLTIGAGAVIEQRIEGNLLAGQVTTVSVEVGGVVYSGTGTFPTSAGTASVTLTGWGTATLGYADGYMYARLSPTAASNVQMVKLELGTVSTLAYDPPADYGVELAKCQRYALKISGYLGRVMEYSETTCHCTHPCPVKMRINPSIASGSITWYTNATSAISNTVGVTLSECDVHFMFTNGSGGQDGFAHANNLVLSADL